MSDNRISFNCEWYDNQASLIRLYIISFYINDNTLEMIDQKNKKVFLKRQQVDKININSFYLGAILNIFSRQLKIIDYADNKTMKMFENQVGKTLAIIKPDAYMKMGKIIDMIMNNGFNIVNMRLVKLSKQDAEQFYAEHRYQSFFDNLTNFMSSDFVLALELIAEDVIKKWRDFIGPTNSLTAKEQAPNSLRAIFGTDGTKNSVHGSDSSGSAQRECEFFFGENNYLKSSAILNNCSCCIIKPHIVRDNKAGKVIDYILEQGFEISALQMFYLDKSTSIEFLDVYKNVLPEYSALCDNLSHGPCIVLEVRQENAVEQFREICGPHDPEIAKNLRPNTIRALFGIDRVKNAVHCTDLKEDGVLECEYFFTILQQK